MRINSRDDRMIPTATDTFITISDHMGTDHFLTTCRLCPMNKQSKHIQDSMGAQETYSHNDGLSAVVSELMPSLMRLLDDKPHCTSAIAMHSVVQNLFWISSRCSGEALVTRLAYSWQPYIGTCPDDEGSPHSRH